MVLDNLKKYNIILASQSPRRQRLLKELNLDFRVEVAGVDETYPEELGMTAIPEFLSELKANAFLERMKKDDLLITADTIVWKDDQVIGKPEDRADAIRILHELSGSQHQVITGMCIQTLEKKYCFHAVTEVWFDELTKEEIEFYVDTHMPFDKAGAYGIQEWIGYIGIRKIEGSFYNVMGLPVHKLYQFLKRF